MAEAGVLPSFVHLYDGASASRVSTARLATFLQDLVRPAAVDVRPEFMRHWLANSPRAEAQAQAAALDMARAKVRQIDTQAPDREPLPAEVDFERRFVDSDRPKPVGLLYDACCLMALYAEHIPAQEAMPEHCHIIVTDQLFGTWDMPNGRYHARVSLYGYPSLLSTTGLVEAPAKPREFYLLQQWGISSRAASDVAHCPYLTRDDPRLAEAMKGCLLQAIFYHVVGDPFCDSTDCRLFNAHWQQELIHAQTRPGADLCPHHKQLLEQWQCRSR